MAQQMAEALVAALQSCQSSEETSRVLQWLRPQLERTSLRAEGATAVLDISPAYDDDDFTVKLQS